MGGDVCVFDFGSVPVNVLSTIIGNLFKSWYYHLEEGTCLNGVYKRLYAPYGGNVFIMPRIYQFKVEIDSNGGKTYFKISEAANGMIMSIDKIIYGKNYLKLELNHIVDEIKYAHLSFEGYLVCDKCNEYYKLQPGETPDDFTDKCECGGKLKYYDSIDWLFKRK